MTDPKITTTKAEAALLEHDRTRTGAYWSNVQTIGLRIVGQTVIVTRRRVSGLVWIKAVDIEGFRRNGSAECSEPATTHRIMAALWDLKTKTKAPWQLELGDGTISFQDNAPGLPALLDVVAAAVKKAVSK